MNKIEADNFKHYRYPGRLEISENGDMAYSVASVDMEKDEYPVNLYVREAACDWRDEALVLEDAKITGFLWIGDTLVINALKEKNDKEKSEKGAPVSVIHAYRPRSKELSELFRLDKKIDYLTPISETEWLLLCADDLRYESLLDECGGDTEAFIREKEKEEAFIIADEYPFRTDEDGYVNKIRRRLYVYDGGLRRITGDDFSVGKIEGLAGEYAVFSGAERPGFFKGDEKLYRIDFKTLEISTLDEKDYLYSHVRAEKGAVIAVRSDKALYGESQNEYIDRIALPGGVVARLNGDCEMHVQNSIYTNYSYGMAGKMFAGADGGVYFIATILDRSHICFGDFDSGEIRAVTDGEINIEDFRLCGGRIFMIGMDRLRGPEIYLIGKDGGGLTPITGYNDSSADSFPAFRPEKFTLMSKDGAAEIYGYAIKPAGFEGDMKYPGVLFIHGGPEMAYGECFYQDMQLLASSGYGVMYCNPRGSAGHGAEFADLRLKYYTVDYDDIMEFLDAVIARNPWIDPERLGVIGGSYGGMMTNWIITHTDRFKAAVSDRGVAFEMQDYFMSDCGFSYAVDVYGKTAFSEGGADDMWDKSAVKYAPFVKTPALFLHGMNDYRCTKEQGIIMFSALKYHGVPSRLVMIEDESHDYSFSGKPKNRVKRFEEILSWFNRFI